MKIFFSMKIQKTVEIITQRCNSKLLASYKIKFNLIIESSI